MKKSITLSIIIMFLTGCGIKESISNIKYENMVKKTVKKESSKPILKNSIKEIIVKKTSVDLSYDRRLSDVLKDLGKLEHRSYYLKINNKTKDITIPTISNPDKVKIKTFKDLNDYLSVVLNKKLIITKNEFIANKTKIVMIKNLNEIKNDFSKINLNINLNNGNFKEVMKKIGEKTKFNIIYGADIDIDMNNLNINYTGNDLSSFLIYLEESFNLYVDIDYDNKIIKFNKYKKRYFNLVISDNNINGTTDNENITPISGSNSLTNTKALTKNIDIAIYTNLKKNLTKLFKADVANGQLNTSNNIKTSTINNQNYFTLNKTTGKIMVSADKKTMQAAEKIIDEFNNSFSKQTKVTLDVYEVLLSNDYNLGADITSNYKNGKNTYKTNILNNVATNVFEFNKINTNSSFKMFLSSLSNIGKIIHTKEYFMQIRNHLPYNKKILISTDYVKSVKTTTNTDNAITTQDSTQETNTVNEGFSITIIPNIVGDNISLSLNPNITQLLNLQDEVYDNNKITLPKTSMENFSTEVILKDGEKIIIGAVSTYEKASTYKGIIPIEDFIIGGNADDKYLRKETIFVVSAKIINK